MRIIFSQGDLIHMQNIQIKEIEVYHPETIIHNDFYIQQFMERDHLEQF